jgi:hypothetical protein
LVRAVLIHKGANVRVRVCTCACMNVIKEKNLQGHRTE